MNENLLKRIKGQLNAKFYVMNDAWLKDCIDFFIKDKASHEITDRHIFEFVEGQWQLSDLREICSENGCLPKNLGQETHTVLNGTYILQVDKMYDIANSKYKQLCKIRKISSDNLEITEKEKPIEWEPKTKRMMQLCLTDGVQDVTAIEYMPLRGMTNSLLPGYKVMIIGPVNYRRGIILLEDGKYREIGGEVESLLTPNALENVLARTLNKPENPDPYHDNGLLRDQNGQNILANPTSDNSFFDDDFEQAVDLEAVTAIEQQSQEINNTVQDDTISTKKQIKDKIEEEFLENIDFEPLDNWSSNPSTRSLQIFPASRIKSTRFEMEDDIMILEEGSNSVYNFQNKSSVLLPPENSHKNENAVEFLNDDFDFDDCQIITETKKLQGQQQNKNIFESENETKTDFLSRVPNSRLANNVVSMDIDKCSSHISTEVSVRRNEKFTASTRKMVQEMPKAQTESDFPASSLSPKICYVLSDILRETIMGTIHRTVRAQVKNHSTLMKQGKCWAVTALIADHTSSIEVSFDSEILETFLGFTVQEFSQKRKLAKSDSQINNELRVSLRKAQHQIENLDALLKLELTQGRMPKVVGITQLTLQQQELMKRSI